MIGATQRLALARRPARAARPQWRRALRATRALLRDPSRTELAFEVALALDPDEVQRDLAQLLAHAVGRRLFRERPSLRAALADRLALARLERGSLGRAYLAHLERHGLDPARLTGLGLEYAAETTGDDEDLRWWSERSSLAHDLWHVLTNLGADDEGEAALLLFSYAQRGRRSDAFLGLAANLELLRRGRRCQLARALAAFRAGRRATCLAALAYEELLPLPLCELRVGLGLPAQGLR